MKILLQEDECAPDAYESFQAEFPRFAHGMTVIEFKARAPHSLSDDEMTSSWRLGDLVLEISADDPYFCLLDVSS